MMSVTSSTNATCGLLWMLRSFNLKSVEQGGVDRLVVLEQEGETMHAICASSCGTVVSHQVTWRDAR